MAKNDGSFYSWTTWGIPLIIALSLGTGTVIWKYSLSWGSFQPTFRNIPVLVFVILLLVRRYIRGPMYTGKAVDMTGKVVLITGANTGIGKETARDLARRGAKVTMLCRNLEKATAAAEELTQDASNPVRVQELDLSSFESIRTCATAIKNQEPKIHVLINNAGVMTCPQWKTKEGLEMQIGTNHFGHFLLTLLLLENIKKSSPSRIINVASKAHEFGQIHWDNLNMTDNYSPTKAYSQSKLANILFTKHLAKILKGTGVTSYALHPGIVRTELGRHIRDIYGRFVHLMAQLFTSTFVKDAVLGAQTTIACAVDEKLGSDTGEYYSDCKKKTPSRRARSVEDAEKLWEISLEIVGLQNHDEAID